MKPDIIKASWLSLLIYVVIAGIAGMSLLPNLNRPFWGQHDWNSNIWTVTAKNNLYHGFLCTKGGQATTAFPITNCNQLGYYQNHPPLISWLITVSYGIFGMDPWVGRLPSVLAAIGSIVLITAIGVRLGGWPVGLAAAGFAIATPLFRYYGKAINHEPLVLFGMLVGTYFYIRLINGDKQAKLWYWLSAIWIGLAGWHGYLLFFGIALVSLWWQPKYKKETWTAVALLGMVFVLHQIHTYWVSGAWNFNLLNQFWIRFSGQGSQNSIIRYSLVKFLKQEQLWIRIYLSNILSAGFGIWVIWTGWKYWHYRQWEPSSFIISILSLAGISVLVLFSQQAYIHDYLLFYLLPAWTLASAWIMYQGLWKRSAVVWQVLVVSIIGLILYQTQPFYQALSVREVERPYVELAQIIGEHNPNRYLLETNNYYNFAFPFLWNYAYGTQIDNRDDSLADFKKMETSLREQYDYIVTVEDHPVVADLMSYLKFQYPATHQGPNTFYSLRSK